MAAHTHILRFNLGLAFSERILDIIIFPTFVAPEALDQVIE
jgi:hypothetical protein